MKNFNILIVFLLVLARVGGQETPKADPNTHKSIVDLPYFGKKIDLQGSISIGEMTRKFAAMSVSDTIKSKFTAQVIDVCQAKGCWMNLQLSNGREVMVRFKDYAFFVPKNIAGKKVVVNGLAYVEDMGIEDQRHFAKDKGRSAKEIDQITRPKRTYGFEADGVLIQE